MPALEVLGRAIRHIEYEVDMLEFCRQAIRDRRTGEKGTAQNDLNAYLEAFAIHARALVCFLYEKEDNGTAMFWSAFVRDEAHWRTARGKKPPALKHVRARVGSEIAHLDFKRAEIGPEAIGWDTEAIATDLRRVMEIFKAHVRPEIIAAARAGEHGPPTVLQPVSVATGTVQTNTTLTPFTIARIG